jgi:TonB family protein
VKVVFGLIVLLSLSAIAEAQTSVRVAVLDLEGDGGGIARLLRETAAGFEAVDPEQIRAALRGAGYQNGPPGYLNPSLDEARSLGAAVGGDYYFAGRVAVTRRLGANDDHYFEAVAGIYLVEARSGRLVLFDYARATNGEQEPARQELTRLIEARRARYTEAINAASARRLEEAVTPPAVIDAIEILDGKVTARALAAPVFYQRLKPVYTTEAASVELVATVELAAVFGADGKVGEVEILRWAGFGLDESATATVKKLRFKPAARDGRAVSVRALVRYTFRRPPSEAEREAEAERLRRSLRRIQQP